MENYRNTNWQMLALVVLRLLIGWHFLYEGLVKLINPGWSAASFLNNSQGPFSTMFHSLTLNPTILNIINFCNQWGLTLIGISLIVGLLSRWFCLAGMALLFLYYACNPPFIGLETSAISEGSYLIVNKNLIELIALWVLFLFPTERIIGLERLAIRYKK